MSQYINLIELEKRINENIKPETIEEKALLEWCKDECIRQAHALPAIYIEEAKCDERIGVELYLKFRQELDKLCVPVILDNLCFVECIVCDGKTVGIVGGDRGYIDVVYVLPEYRRKGLAKRAVLEWYNRYKAPYENTRLHIINNNIPALQFWNSIFDLWEIGHNEIDTLYEILNVKSGAE